MRSITTRQREKVGDKNWRVALTRRRGGGVDCSAVYVWTRACLKQQGEGLVIPLVILEPIV